MLQVHESELLKEESVKRAAADEAQRAVAAQAVAEAKVWHMTWRPRITSVDTTHRPQVKPMPGFS
jgi:hypothetical protein